MGKLRHSMWILREILPWKLALIQMVLRMRLSASQVQMEELWEKWDIQRGVIPIFIKICQEIRTRNCLSQELRIFHKL